jgi:hypothetical protein
LWRKATGEMEIFAESDYVVVEVSALCATKRSGKSSSTM